MFIIILIYYYSSLSLFISEFFSISFSETEGSNVDVNGNELTEWNSRNSSAIVAGIGIVFVVIINGSSVIGSNSAKSFVLKEFPSLAVSLIHEST